MEKTLTREEETARKHKKTTDFRCYTRWVTSDEINFIKRIGTHCSRTTGLSRKQLLERYKATMPARQSWGDVDPVFVLSYVEKEIEKCR